ncbi:M56 family metallopeptidase [Diplocloster agilis]|uniref:M56 family metallopeptidase n=1 Tax=Diplocloster agilis TaxID=2850323 RepID=UPI0008216732|nr:M56 family metallopeptidase [Suonthocola fibrivorans]MCU6736665.1 M56 family metallopeptidase [Suonthocola fibrivorans]SCJ92687.1 Regulatory protein BlaR1 [uncultured Clostridium sp.]
MTELFLGMVGVSVTSALILIPLLLLSQVINRRIRMSWKKGIWLMLAVRLLIPVPYPEAVFHVRLSGQEIQTAMKSSEKEPAGQNAQSAGTKLQGTGTELQGAGTEQQGGSENKLSPAAGNPSDRKDRDGMTAAGASDGFRYIIWIWAAVAVGFFLCCLIRYYMFAEKIKQSAEEVTDPFVWNTFTKLSGQLGLKPGRVTLNWSGELSLPCAFGYFRPRICLPKRRMEEQELTYLLKHELLHVKQQDIWYKLLFLVVNALYWFHPLIYLMRREAYKDMECCCDELVLKDAGPSEKKAYALILLAAASFKREPDRAFSTGFAESKKSLEERLKNVMNSRRKRLGAVAAVLAALLLVLTGGLLKLQQSGSGKDLLTRMDLTQEEENGITGKETSGTAAKYSYEIDASYRSVKLQLEMWVKGELQDILGQQILPLNETKGELTAAFDSDAIFRENQDIGWRAGVRQIPEGFFHKRISPESMVMVKWSVRMPQEPQFIGASYGCLGDLASERVTPIEEDRPIVLAQLIMDADNRLEVIPIDPTDKETLRSFDLVYLLTCRFSKEAAD